MILLTPPSPGSVRNIDIPSSMTDFRSYITCSTQRTFSYTTEPFLTSTGSIHTLWQPTGKSSWQNSMSTLCGVISSGRRSLVRSPKQPECLSAREVSWCCNMITSQFEQSTFEFRATFRRMRDIWRRRRRDVVVFADAQYGCRESKLSVPDGVVDMVRLAVSKRSCRRFAMWQVPLVFREAC